MGIFSILDSGVIEIQGEQLLLANGQDSKGRRYGIVGFVDVREDLDARYSIATLGIFGLDMGTMAWMGTGRIPNPSVNRGLPLIAAWNSSVFSVPQYTMVCSMVEPADLTYFFRLFAPTS